MNSTWSEERIEELKRGCAQGVPFSEIARDLCLLPPYTHVSRNAAIGKASREGMEVCVRRGGNRTRASVRGSSRHIRKHERRHVYAKSVTREAKALANLPTAPMPLPQDTDIPRVSFMELENHHCRWPCAEHAGFDKPVFCGKEKVPGLPYCEDHARRAYQVPKVVQREPERGTELV